MVKHFSDYKKVFDVDITKLIYQILLRPEIQQEIIEYNQSQLTDGIDSNNEKIITIRANEQNQGEVYSLFTIQERKSQGLQTINVDLKDTGVFWDSFFIKVTKDSFEILGDFSKPDGDIRDNFDSSYDFLGLTDANLDFFAWDTI
jgi:hypothetical protein